MEAIITAAEEAVIDSNITPIGKGGIFDHFTDERVEILRDSLNQTRDALINLDAETYLSSTRIKDKKMIDSSREYDDAKLLEDGR